MDRKLIILGKTGRYDVPSFVWTENEPLTITFDIQETRVGRFYAVIRCGNRIMERSLAKYMSIQIPADFIKNGEYQPITISLEFRDVNGEKIIVSADPKRGGYFIEPLRIERTQESLVGVAWCQELEEKINALNVALAGTKENVSAVTEYANSIPTLIKQEINNAVIYLTNGDPLKS